MVLNSTSRLSAECLQRIHQDKEGRLLHSRQQRSLNGQELYPPLPDDGHHSGAFESLDGMIFDIFDDEWRANLLFPTREHEVCRRQLGGLNLPWDQTQGLQDMAQEPQEQASSQGQCLHSQLRFNHSRDH
ncbi:hypothetical protein N7490_001990 [Penicillium lividum]|nr:hypothetical protein N7490_001990 [Penicillium lividum]